MTPPRTPISRPVAALLLAGRFLRALAVSGVGTVTIILAAAFRRRPPSAGFVRFRLDPLSPTAATVLGCLVCLTPGTTTVDIDPDSGEVLLHALDATSPAGLEAEIRRDFDGLVRILFPRRTP